MRLLRGAGGRHAAMNGHFDDRHDDGRFRSLLREADIPVESTRGRHGGYRLGRGIRLPPLIFGADDAVGLVMALLDGRHAGADAEDPAGVALGKIIRALPEGVARQASALRRHASAAPDRGAARPSPETTGALVAASAARRSVRVQGAPELARPPPPRGAVQGAPARGRRRRRGADDGGAGRPYGSDASNHGSNDASSAAVRSRSGGRTSGLMGTPRAPSTRLSAACCGYPMT